MRRLNPERLKVKFLERVTERAPLIPRRYSFVRSDQELLLTIGTEFEFDIVDPPQVDVLGEWLWVQDGIRFYVYLNVEDQPGVGQENRRKEYYIEDMLLGLEAIRYGDRTFFKSHPEMDQYPITVYYLYENPENNKLENWGTFADFNIELPGDVYSQITGWKYHELIDEKVGDVNGDEIPDRISLYGDIGADPNLVQSMIIEVEGGQSKFKVDMITEINSYNPALFLGDVTKDNINDIIFTMEKGFNSMNSNDKGEYSVAIYTIQDNMIETIFSSNRYNTENMFLVEFDDFYKVRIINVDQNKLFFLDISYKGYEYLSQYYDEHGILKNPVQGKVLELGSLIPVVDTDTSYNLLANHRIIGSRSNDTLGYLNNLLSWNGEKFISISMLVSVPGINLIPDQY
ncbi:MAG: hypothetical protein K0S47_4286 [Herbinix sp.]|nr:hypothetical protein [Herbinix sp.]